MSVTPPSSVPTTGLAAATDDPKTARGSLLTLTTSFNTVLGQYNSIGITQPGDGIEIVTAAAGTRDGLAVKLDGGSLARSASGLKIAAGGITLAMLGQNGAATDNIIKWSGSAWVVAAPAATGNQKRKSAVYTSVGSTNWTVPSGVTEVKVTVVGGGGAGGTAGSTANEAVGSGGGGGGTAIKWVTGLTPGSTVNVTVGGAGSSSFFGASGSPMCRATGGSSGGVVYTAGGVAGGAGGIGNVGDVLMRGQDGGCGIIAGSYASGGTGGSSSMGGGGGGGAPGTGTSAAGTVGGAYGGGGGGGAKSGAAGSASGGGGASGLVLIEWIEA
jgi:hypothetical protein